MAELERPESDMNIRSMRLLLAEAIGTTLLVASGIGTAVLADGRFGVDVGALGIGLAFGLAWAALLPILHPVSGCHLNPAVTIAMWLVKRTDGARLWQSIVGQLVGAFIGAEAVYLVADNGPDSFTATPQNFAGVGWEAVSPGGFGLLGVIVAEVVLTALVVFVFIGATEREQSPAVAGLSAGLALSVATLVALPVSGAGLNPARILATALFAGGDAVSQLPGTLLFPLIGSLLAYLLWTALGDAETPSVNWPSRRQRVRSGRAPTHVPDHLEPAPAPTAPAPDTQFRLPAAGDALWWAPSPVQEPTRALPSTSPVPTAPVRPVAAPAAATPAPDGDDLTVIRGIGAVMQQHLHDHGVTTLAALAVLDAQAVERIEASLPNFGGRIARDRWVEQARELVGDQPDDTDDTEDVAAEPSTPEPVGAESTNGVGDDSARPTTAIAAWASVPADRDPRPRGPDDLPMFDDGDGSAPMHDFDTSIWDDPD